MGASRPPSPSEAVRVLAETVRQHGSSCGGGGEGNNGNPVAMKVADIHKFHARLSKRQSAWVKSHGGVDRFVLEHGGTAPGIELRLSLSKKSIVLEADVPRPTECTEALIGYMQAKCSSNGSVGTKIMHLKLVPDFLKIAGTVIRDVILGIKPEHHGREVLPKSIKKGARLKSFVKAHGRIVPGYVVGLKDANNLILTATNTDQTEQRSSVMSVPHVKCVMEELLVSSIELNERQRAALDNLLGEDKIGVDLEGRLQQEDPCISLLQLGSADGKVFLVLDLITCPQLLLPPEEGGADAISTQLRSLLLERELFMHDCRNDCAALWAQFGIVPTKVFDTQVAFSVVKYGADRPWMRHGFNDVAKAHGVINPLKKQIQHGQGLWEQRPLPQDLLVYAIFDVLPLGRMSASMKENCNEKQIETIHRCSNKNASSRRDISVKPSYLDGAFYKAVSTGQSQAASPSVSADETTARKFHRYINSEAGVRDRCSDRTSLEQVFEEWSEKEAITTLLPVLMTILRRIKLLKSSRHGDIVVMVFALPDGTFPSQRARAKARAKAMRSRKELEANKHGVQLSCSLDTQNIVVPLGHQVQTTDFVLKNSNGTSLRINRIDVLGANRSCFTIPQVSATTSCDLPGRTDLALPVNFSSSRPGVYRAVLALSLNNVRETFTIARFLTVRTGDSDVNDLLKPIAPFKRVQRKMNTVSGAVVPAPKAAAPRGGFPVPLLRYEIESSTRSLLKGKEMDSLLAGFEPVSTSTYKHFWQNMLWAAEYQTSLDIMLFDMEDVSLNKKGRYFSLRVPGLAEGRPSVLRGDKVIVTLKGRRSYAGLTVDTHLEDVILDFKRIFHEHYDERVDRVNVRFTFSRASFMAGHQGCTMAPDTMGRRMLFPDDGDKRQSLGCEVSRSIPGGGIKWRNHALNPEQRAAVENILKGSARPLPYVLFGPPGTGKTTTLVETVLHLAKHEHQLKILVVAPSNDATDNVVERLADCFPPSEMRRVLAMSRTLDQVAPKVMPYVVEGLKEAADVEDITSKRIVVATVNMAAKFFNKGIEPGHFDVLCVDEAGHAVETEVIAVAATLMDFKREDHKRGQLVLAGDPKQLGPFITSDLCKSFGMEISYMERLTELPIYQGHGGSYPKELITKLVRNFRSHPQILKLPNEMFYENELIACGDHFQTHFRWEHLPRPDFPVLFHGVMGENEREANSPSWFNRYEAGVVLDYVRLLVKNSRPPVDMDEIGVITPYARQVQKIRLLLKANDLGGVKVGSVETFQGQERRCIIVSTVRSSKNYLQFDAKYNLGFVNHPKRFNVTVTRAKALLIVIGQPHVLATDAKHWRPLLQMCKDAGSWEGEEWSDDSDGNGDGGEEEDLRRMGMLDEEESDGEDAGEHVSHAVNQEAVPFMNREE